MGNSSEQVKFLLKFSFVDSMKINWGKRKDSWNVFTQAKHRGHTNEIFHTLLIDIISKINCSGLPRSIILDIDPDREMERIHSLFLANIEKLEKQQGQLDMIRTIIFARRLDILHFELVIFHGLLHEDIGFTTD